MKIFRSKPFKIMRTEVYVRTCATDYFKCPGCGYEIEDIEHKFNDIEDWIVFECSMCGVDLQVEPPPKENVMLIKNALPQAQEGRTIHYIDPKKPTWSCGGEASNSTGSYHAHLVNCLKCRKTRAFKEAIKVGN